MGRTTKRTLKFLHEVGTVGLMGAVCAQMILSFAADGMPPDRFATMRWAVLLISEWLLVPSLMVVLSSGLFAMAVHSPFHNAGWAWIKAALTVLVLEGTLIAVQGPAQVAATISAEIAAGDSSSAELLPRVIRHERGGMGVILFLSVVNIALAVWRPRLRRRRAAVQTEANEEAVDPAAPKVADAEAEDAGELDRRRLEPGS